MTQYVLQILDSTQQLVKSYKVDAEHPIRAVVPEGRTQVIITDDSKYAEIISVYEEYTTRAHFSWDGINITWEII